MSRRGSRPSGRSLVWMAGVSLAVLFGYERMRGGAAPKVGTVRPGARRAVA